MKKYATFEDGLGYRSISKKLRRKYDICMAPSAVRLEFIKCMQRFARGILKYHEYEYRMKDLTRIARNQDFHEYIAKIVQQIYMEEGYTLLC